MNRKFSINALTGEGLDEAIKGLEDYQKRLDDKAKELVTKLSEIGLKVAKVMFSTARYDGDNDVSVSIEERGDAARAVVATGKATLYLEFGSGYMMGYGHPEAGEYGMGPGTWSDGPQGKGHWKDPDGWYLPKSKGGGHSFGNPPAAAMYSARKEIEMEIARIAREVFGSV